MLNINSDPGSTVSASTIRFNIDGINVGTFLNNQFRLGSNSAGIQFHGDTAAANSLDDYEEGTFTPTYGWGSSSQSGFTTSSNYGRYTKIGRLVHIQFWTNFTATPSSNSTLQIQLPFPSANDSGYRGGISFSFSGITYIGNSTYSQGGRTHLNHTQSWMDLGFQSFVNGGTWTSSAITASAMANDSNFQAEGVYMTDT
jgi:hypothetical protein